MAAEVAVAEVAAAEVAAAEAEVAVAVAEAAEAEVAEAGWWWSSGQGVVQDQPRNQRRVRGSVAPELGEVRAGPIGLDALGRAGASLGGRAVDDLEVGASLGEDDLDVRAAAADEIAHLELDDELPVRRAADGRREHPLSARVPRVHVVPEKDDGPALDARRQTAVRVLEVLPREIDRTPFELT